MEINGDADDLDEDITRLQIVLQADEEKDVESDAEGELQSLHQDAEDEHRSFASRSRPSTRPSTCSDVTASSYPPTSVGPEGEDRYQLLDPSNANPESCLAMNRAYQEVLLDLLRQTEMSLNENRVKQKELEEDIDRLSSGNKQTGYKNIGKTFAVVSIPYFKNKSGESPPDNPDVAAKQDLQESKQHVRPQTSWSKFARKKLISAVAMDTLEKMLRPVMSRLELESEKMRQCRNQEEIDACRDRIETLQEEIAIKKQIPERELIKNVDSDKVDWMKIGVTGFECKMDAADCERTWKNILRPEINREKWSEEEDADLQILVEKHNMRNWAVIAKELGTNRTPFQCLQHYQQHSQVYDNSPWTPEEDELLKEVVETCKFGKDTVQFYQVAYYIDGRSATMCRKRWEDINPQKRKGRWTAHEDCLLMAGVQMFGNNNWLKVGELVPTRNVTQCRERWMNVLCPDLRPKIWNYEEDKEMLRLVQEHGPNWALIATLIPGRTDNNILQRYRRLMTWKQQCEDFFAMPERVQKNMILGQRQLEKKKRLRGAKRKFFAEKKPNLSELNWYKRQDNLYHYGDVGYLAKQLGTADEVYSKIIQDRENNELIAPRPLPITKYTHRNSLAMWRRKCHLQSLVEAEIKKVLEETKDSEYQPKEVADRVAASLEPAVIKRHKKEVNRVEISRAMQGKDPNELTVRQLLKISRSIKETGKAESDTEEQEGKVKVKDEGSDDSFDESEIVGRIEEKRRHRPMAPDHKKKLMEGRGRHYEINRNLQRTIWTKHKTKHPTKSSGKRKKYRLFSKKVFKSHLSAEEQDKLRRKSLLLMLKSMGVDSVQAFKKARRRFKKYSAFLNQQEDEKNNTEDQTKKSSTDDTGHSLRHRSRSSIVGLFKRSSKPKDVRAEMSETTKLMLEVGKELNVPEDDGESEDAEEDVVKEVVTPPRKKRRYSRHDQEKAADIDKAEGGDEKAVNEENKTTDSATDVQQKANTAVDPESEYVQNKQPQTLQNTVNTTVDNPQKPASEQSTENTELENSNSKEVKGKDEVGKSGEPGGENQGQMSVGNVDKTDRKVLTKDDPPVKPYTKKLPFIPPNHTNLLALKKLLLNKEKLFDKAADDFRVPELRREFYEKPRENTTPFVKTLLSVINPDVLSMKKRNKRKLDSEIGKISFSNCMESVKQSPEFNQLKARFCAVFTWPALISTIKPPKDGQLVVPGSAAIEQNGKDSEKENYDGVTVKKEVITSSEESSESEEEINSKYERQRKGFNTQDDNILNENENDVNIERSRRGRRPYGGKNKEMVQLVYKDLETMGDVELTDKEEMEIMIMNIITRRLGDRKKEISQAQYNRERGKTLRRLGMFDKMKALEERELHPGEENMDLTEIKQEPKPKKKRLRRKRSPVEPRRSSRISQHKPLEVYASRKTNEHMVHREETVLSPTPSENEVEIIIPENNVTINEGMQQEVTIIQESDICPATVSSDPAGISQNSAISETVLIGSDNSDYVPEVSSSLASSVPSEITSPITAAPSSAMTPIVFTLPPTSAVGASTTQASGSAPSAPAPFVFMTSPVKPTSSQSEATAASGVVPLMIASPGSSAPGTSSLGVYTLPLLPSMGLPTSTSATTSSGQAGTELTSQGLALTSPPLEITNLSAVTTASTNSSSASLTGLSTSISYLPTAPLMASLPALNQKPGSGIPAIGGRMDFQGAVGNNLVPMMVFVNSEQLSMLNAGSVTNTSVIPSVTNSGIGSVNNSVVTTSANVDKSHITNASTDSRKSNADNVGVSSHTDDAIKVNDSEQENNKDSVSNSAIIVENNSPENESAHTKASTSDRTESGNNLHEVEMNHQNGQVSACNTKTTEVSEVPTPEVSEGRV